MNVRNGWLKLTGAVLVTTAGALGAWAQDGAAPADSSGSNLRWTPHRIASAPVEAPAAPATQAAPAAIAAGVPGQAVAPPTTATAASTTPRLPPASAASVGLPPGVPPVADAAPARPGYAPLRQNFTLNFGDVGGWMSNNRLAGNLQTSAPADPDSIFGINVIRAPQGERGRPVLAAEVMPRGPKYPSANRLAAGGGDAPRFNPAAPQARPRDRIAMNVDAMPSVMARNAQSAALDDAAVPGRLPAAAQPTPAQTLPSPAPAATIPPSTTLELEMDGMSGMGGMPADMPGMTIEGGFDPTMAGPASDPGMWMGQYPAQVHVESFYDDPYACEDEEPFCLPLCQHDGRICAWLRRFGRPYYGWRWYRDFTASAGVTSFTNPTDLGIHGNYGVNEYLNWAMPFWNAFGVGWQVGVRGVQTSFQPTTLTINGTPFTKGSRDQVFVTTGFFTRAFEGRGLQGGAVYDYLSDGWFTDVNVAQIRSELSYVWGYHEIGYWGAHNVTEQLGIFAPRRSTQITGTTLDLYTGFYRLHFGDANEWRVWGGASGNGDGLVGSSMRAPMTRSLALEGTFTYLIPKQTERATVDEVGTISTFGPAAWNVSVNLVYYPAGRSRRSLASPYRPLFDVADNGNMIRSLVLPNP
ncbi:MAG: DUF6666 family protein [Planctomycetia bacterium]